MVRIKRVKVSASKSRLTSIRRPLASNTSKARLLSALPLRRLRATFTSTSRSHSPCPPASLRRLFNARCNVLSAKPWLLQNSTCRCPLASNSVTRRLISWLPRRFRTLTSSLSVMPRVDQNRAGVPRWVRLTDTPQEEELSENLQSLYEALWAPIGQALPSQTKRIIISPDGQLNFISFATLLTKDKQFMAQKY